MKNLILTTTFLLAPLSYAIPGSHVYAKAELAAIAAHNPHSRADTIIWGGLKDIEFVTRSRQADGSVASYRVTTKNVQLICREVSVKSVDSSDPSERSLSSPIQSTVIHVQNCQ